MNSSKQRTTGLTRPRSVFSFLSDAAGRVPLRIVGPSALLALGCLAGLAYGSRPVFAPSAQAQSTDPGSSAQPPAPFGANQGARPGRPQDVEGSASPDPFTHAQEEQMNIKRTTERQKAIVADTTRLLQLAQELKLEVDKSTKDQLSVSVVKKAEDIEKLAKTVKEKMKGF